MTELQDRPKMVTVLEVEAETPLIKTLSFSMDKIRENAEPGHFLMVWIPRMDEIPLSLSAITPNLAITVKKIGEATEALHKIGVGDKIGIRGPYGHPFSIKGQFPLIIGGGIGMAPFLFLIEPLQETAQKITIINGARTKAELLFLKKLQKLSQNKFECIFTTDDGSFGLKGNASTIAIQELQNGSYDHVYTCGPEPMMWELFTSTEKLKIPMQTCLERLMKCGIGLCGQCCVDPLGYRVCVEGPVFNSEVLRKLSDFGKFKRDFGGHKYKI